MQNDGEVGPVAHARLGSFRDRARFSPFPTAVCRHACSLQSARAARVRPTVLRRARPRACIRRLWRRGNQSATSFTNTVQEPHRVVARHRQAAPRRQRTAATSDRPGHGTSRDRERPATSGKQSPSVSIDSRPSCGKATPTPPAARLRRPRRTSSPAEPAARTPGHVLGADATKGRLRPSPPPMQPRHTPSSSWPLSVPPTAAVARPRPKSAPPCCLGRYDRGCHQRTKRDWAASTLSK